MLHMALSTVPDWPSGKVTSAMSSLAVFELVSTALVSFKHRVRKSVLIPQCTRDGNCLSTAK